MYARVCLYISICPSAPFDLFVRAPQQRLIIICWANQVKYARDQSTTETKAKVKQSHCCSSSSNSSNSKSNKHSSRSNESETESGRETLAEIETRPRVGSSQHRYISLMAGLGSSSAAPTRNPIGSLSYDSIVQFGKDYHKPHTRTNSTTTNHPLTSANMFCKLVSAL